MEIINSDGTILVVDDSINNIELLSNILEEDYEIIFATSGEKALTMIPKLLPDLILLDIVMPKMDGYEVIRVIKSNPQTMHVPVIFITAKSTTEDMVNGFKMGAVDYISKPFAAEEVKVRVKTHIENQLLFKALKKINQQLELLSKVDGLTGIANRRHFDEFLQQMVNRSKRYNHVFSLMLIDIDFFKFYNDLYGHQQGDDCLIKVSKQLSQCAQRDGELAARYGGEEFAIILSEKSEQQALEHAQHCQQSIQALKIEHAKSSCAPFVTISVGLVTIINSSDISAENIIQNADAALYKAKDSGRNQVQVYLPE